MKLAIGKLYITTVFILAFIPSLVSAQNLTGIWRGYFITENGEQYKYELQVDQARNNQITGVSYSYLDTRFYGKAVLTGHFSTSNKSALVQEIKTVELRMSGNSSACIMKCLFTFITSGREQFLEGTFSSAYEKTEPLLGINRGGNCGGGKVVLRKVTTSDFYVEPFLKNKPQFKENDPVVKKPTAAPPAKKKVTPPVARNKPKQKPSTTIVKKKPTEKIQTDNTLRKAEPPVVNDRPMVNPHISIPQITRSRQNELVQTLTVTNNEITVRLYDNGEIDDDTVSVYLDGKPLTMNRRLSTIPITLNIKMDDDNADHTLIMYAENMGRIPPNTSLMIVQDGDKRYQVNITSTEQKNAMVRFRYQKRPD